VILQKVDKNIPDLLIVGGRAPVADPLPNQPSYTSFNDWVAEEKLEIENLLARHSPGIWILGVCNEDLLQTLFKRYHFF
jgi:hypothetical protein